MLTKSFVADGVMGGFYFVLCSVLTFKKYLLHLIWYNSIQCALVCYQKVQRQLTKVSINYKIAAAAAAKLLQSCPTLWDPIDFSLPGSSVHATLQERILERVTISFSRGSSQSSNWMQVSHIAGIFFTIWVTREAHILESWSIKLTL